MNTAIQLWTGPTAVVIVIVMLACLYSIKRWRTKRAQQSSIVQHNDEGVQDDIYSVEYQAINRYWQIRDEDIGISCVPPAVKQEERGHRLSLPVLAECFSTSGGGTYNDASESSAGETQSYIHISQDVSDGKSSQSSPGDTQSYIHVSHDVAGSGATQSSAGDTQSYIHISHDVAGSGATQSSAGDTQSSTQWPQNVAGSSVAQCSAGDTQSSTHISHDVSDGESSQSSAGDARSHTHISRDKADSDSSHSSASDAQSYTRLLRDVFVDDPKTAVSYISPVHK
ncbi:uncharacterized protein LOC125378167 [Haliotis rufescens]|uniref:uncharacterized protein LOC125378167 n=1 Tax=Haliotis rufescens TaxID=6454 RepID=UPI00201F6EBF|nr:uncharacterized protein LOC125378167 [Haliotis rufescens]